jgi:hypothetical protein
MLVSAAMTPCPAAAAIRPAAANAASSRPTGYTTGSPPEKCPTAQARTTSPAMPAMSSRLVCAAGMAANLRSGQASASAAPISNAEACVSVP